MELVLELIAIWKQKQMKGLAAHMLLEAWKDEEKEQMLDHYHWINNTGCLEIEDIQAIARKVW